MGSIFIEKLAETPFVYHYTKMETLFAILEGYRQNKEKGFLPFRANCIYNMNDPREMTIGFDAVKKFLPEYEKIAKYNMDLSEVYLDADKENQCRKECIEKPIDGTIEKGMVPYTMSFSTKEDFLPMWKMYGDDFKGVCLKFDLLELTKYLYDDCQFGFVSYDGEVDVSYLKEIFSSIYDWEAKHRESMDINEKIEELSLLCVCISPFVKSSDWAYEQEFRIEISRFYNLEIDRESLRKHQFNGLIRKRVEPYVYYPICPNALQEIIIGPHADFNTYEYIIRKELKECLLNDVKIIPSSIEIR